MDDAWPCYMGVESKNCLFAKDEPNNALIRVASSSLRQHRFHWANKPLPSHLLLRMKMSILNMIHVVMSLKIRVYVAR